MQITVRIQHHPSRKRLLPALKASLAPLPVEVVTDPDPDGQPNPWRTYHACLSSPPNCSHLLIVQDDVQVCRDFPAAVTVIAERQPDFPVALFLGGVPFHTIKMLRKLRYGAGPYVVMHPSDPLPVVATLWPLHKAVEFLAWTEEHPVIGKSGRSDDQRGSTWMNRTRQTVLATQPSLVEHPGRARSLIFDQKGPDLRRAHRFIGSEDPLAVRW